MRPALSSLVAGTLALGLAVAACRPEPRERPRPRVRLTSGTPGAGFLRLSEALAREYRQRLPYVDVTVHQTAGALTNIEAIERGDADLGLSHADVTYLAFAGHLPGQPRPFSRLRGIAMLQSQRVHLVVAARSGIRRVDDLRRHRRVSVGPGAGRTSTAGIVLDAFGVGPPVTDVQGLRYAEAPARLAEGTLDAFFVTGSGPLEAVTSATRGGARIVPLEGPIVDRLCRDYPFFRRVVIPGGLYPGHPEPIRTIGVDSVLICRADLEEALVYDLTRRLFEILPSLSAHQWPAHEGLRGPIDIERAPATPIPLHEGAARYYREQELSR